MQYAAIAALAFGVLVQPLFAGQDDLSKKVDQIFAAYAQAGSPGCSLGVMHDGTFVYRESYGAASLELGVALSSHSVFYVGSVSKQFTAASVVLAAEQGFLSLDDDVRKYIPELPDYGPRSLCYRCFIRPAAFETFSIFCIFRVSTRLSSIHPARF